MALHVVTHGLLRTKSDGSLMPGNASIQDRLTFDIQDRVIEVADSPNSVGSPTVKDYLILEEASGFFFEHMDQTYIITR